MRNISGAILFKRRKITENGSESLANLLITLILPCVIIRSFLIEPAKLQLLILHQHFLIPDSSESLWFPLYLEIQRYSMPLRLLHAWIFFRPLMAYPHWQIKRLLSILRNFYYCHLRSALLWLVFIFSSDNTTADIRRCYYLFRKSEHACCNDNFRSLFNQGRYKIHAEKPKTIPDIFSPAYSNTGYFSGTIKFFIWRFLSVKNVFTHCNIMSDRD